MKKKCTNPECEHPVKDVSGFHVENNLQVITHSRNAVKHNKFTPIWGVA